MGFERVNIINGGVIMKVKGFTLIEVIVVIAIIAALSAILIPVMASYVKDSKIAAVSANAKG